MSSKCNKKNINTLKMKDKSSHLNSCNIFFHLFNLDK